MVVVKCGASGHNIRSRPGLNAAPVGKLALGNTVTIQEYVSILEYRVIKDEDTPLSLCLCYTVRERRGDVGTHGRRIDGQVLFPERPGGRGRGLVPGREQARGHLHEDRARLGERADGKENGRPGSVPLLAQSPPQRFRFFRAFRESRGLQFHRSKFNTRYSRLWRG